MDDELARSDQEKSADYDDEFLEYEVNALVYGDGTPFRGKYSVHMGLYATRGAPMDVYGYFRIVEKRLSPPPASNDASSSAQVSYNLYKLFGNINPDENLKLTGSSNALLEKVISFVKENPEIVVQTGCVGACGHHPALEKYVVKELGLIHAECNTLGCVLDSLLNFVLILRGTYKADEVFDTLKKMCVTFRNLKGLAPHIRNLKMRLNFGYLEAAKRKSIQQDPMVAAFKVIANLNDGICLVRLKQNKKSHALIGHVVLVVASRKLIIDISEEWLIKLTAKTLRMCGVTDNAYLQIAEIRSVINL